MPQRIDGLMDCRMVHCWGPATPLIHQFAEPPLRLTPPALFSGAASRGSRGRCHA